MVTIQELELLASLLQRAGITPIEAMWANSILQKLREMVMEKTNDDSKRTKEGNDGPGE